MKHKVDADHHLHWVKIVILGLVVLAIIGGFVVAVLFANRAVSSLFSV